jgi:hypothetical protein
MNMFLLENIEPIIFSFFVFCFAMFHIVAKIV